MDINVTKGIQFSFLAKSFLKTKGPDAHNDKDLSKKQQMLYKNM